MTNQEFIEGALRTEPATTPELLERLASSTRLLHSAMGLSTESGEFLDAIKKHIFYGAPLDTVNLSEELGDLLWYISIAIHELGLSFEEVMDQNNRKLRTRFPLQFTESLARVRDLESERRELERNNAAEAGLSEGLRILSVA